MAGRSAPEVDPGEALVERVRAGDPAAFTDLFRSYRGLVWRVLRHLLYDDPELEDVVQLTFVEVHRSLPSFEGRSRLSSWITRVALHVGYHHLRRKKSRPADYRASPNLPEQTDDGLGADPERALVARRAQARLGAVLARLPEKKRTVFILVELEGLSREQVAEIVGTNPATVRTRLHYARRDFWKAVAEDEGLRDLIP